MRSLFALLLTVPLLLAAPPIDPAAIEPAPRLLEKTTASSDPGARNVHEYFGDPTDKVLRDLARKARIHLLPDASIAGTVTIRLENKTAREALEVICAAKGLVLDELAGIYYVRPWDHEWKRKADVQAHQAKLLLDAYIAKGFTRAEAMQLVAARGQNSLGPKQAAAPTSGAASRRRQ